MQLAKQDDRVRMLGPRYGEEKAWLLHNAATFVQPSSIEGLPIALLEALAAGCYPVVSSIPENLEPVTVEGDQLVPPSPWATRPPWPGSAAVLEEHRSARHRRAAVRACAT